MLYRVVEFVAFLCRVVFTSVRECVMSSLVYLRVCCVLKNAANLEKRVDTLVPLPATADCVLTLPVRKW